MITNSKKKNNNVSLLSPHIPKSSNNTISNKKNINSVEQSQLSPKKQDICLPPKIMILVLLSSYYVDIEESVKK
jgi:hypothetical protein